MKQQHHCWLAVCLILLSTLALASAYSAMPKYYEDMVEAANQNYQRRQRSPYNNNNGFSSNYNNNFGNNYNNNYKTSSNSDKDAEVVHSDSDIKADGSYFYEFETTNGIKQAEQGTPDGTKQGSSSYISPEGIEIKTTYVADETGYHPVGDHIPKIPDYILRSLEYIRTHPYVEKDYYTGELKQASFNNFDKVLPQRRQSNNNYNNN
ncbi:pupal cuticle protein-like, partial [Musca vetustissima]|uniref:pupal cuticle protein-like n=1 Tax=Musca vetustissima TaxID=27455 RepID=UPI002AB6C037